MEDFSSPKISKPFYKKIWFWILVAVIIIIIIAIVNGVSAQNTTNTDNSIPSDSPVLDGASNSVSNTTPSPTEEGVTNEPVIEEPVIEEPVIEEPVIEEPAVETPQQQMFKSVVDLINQGLAFDTGSHIAGEIPAGDYAFVKFANTGSYYSEEDAGGNIIDNENFDSFGYVTVHAAGNIQNDGVLINISAFENLGVSSAKEIYEILNNQTDFKQAGMYKIGTDLPAGTYTIQSLGEGYIAILSGPISNSEIIDNEIFNGNYQVTVSDGQYLQLSRAMIQ